MSIRYICDCMNPEQAPSFFKAMSDPNRIRILSRLCNQKRPFSVNEVRDFLGLDQSVVSRHLSQMKHAGLLESQRSGKETLYAVNFEPLSATLRSMADYLDNCCHPN